MAHRGSNVFKLNQLPIEVLVRVFYYLPQISLLECQKVCKIWNTLSSRFFWENIKIKNRNQAELILQYLSTHVGSNSIKFYVKKIEIIPFIGLYSGLQVNLVMKLLVNFPNIQEIYLDYMDSASISRLGSSEYLTILCQNCPNITSFKLGEYHFCGDTIIEYQEDYNHILYALRHTLLKMDIMGKKDNTNHWDLSETLKPYPQLEELDLFYIQGIYGIKWWLPIFKVLPRLKSLIFHINYYQDPCLIDQNVEVYIDSNTLRQRLGAIEKLVLCCDRKYLHWFSPAITRFITQYFVGLKEIILDCSISDFNSLNQEDLRTCQELLNFVCTRVKYDVFISYTQSSVERNTIINNLDFQNIILKTNFDRTLLDNKNVLNRLQIWLNCMYKYSTNNNIMFDIKLVTHRLNNYKILRTTKYNVTFNEQHKDLIHDSLRSALSILNDIDVLALKITDEMANSQYPTLHSIDQILSMTPKSTKKIVLVLLGDIKWNNMTFKYKKWQAYFQFTQLEISVNFYDYNSRTYNLSLYPFSIIFPNIKFLTLQLYTGIWNNEYECLMEMPHLNLDCLTLDVTLIKLNIMSLIQTHHDDFYESFFILHLETGRKSCYYQIFLDDLIIKDITTKSINEMIDKSKYVMAHIILKDIKCLELYLLNGIRYHRNLYSLDGKEIGNDQPQKKIRNTIYFTE